jgi:hypothetical protein
MRASDEGFEWRSSGPPPREVFDEQELGREKAREEKVEQRDELKQVNDEEHAQQPP